MSQSNAGKWKSFSDGSRLYGPAGTGQNLNDDLQKRLANEMDAIQAESVGDGVVGYGAGGFQVSADVGLSVTVAPGQAYVQGQRVSATLALPIVGLPPNSTVKVYLSASAPFNTSVPAWPAAVGQTSGALAPGQLLLATVTTDGAAVTVVVDGRVFVESQGAQAAALSDTEAPAAAAVAPRQRFGMLARRLKDIVGGATWLEAVPASLTSLVASAAALLAKFDPSTGHRHTGASGDGPSLNQVDTHGSPDTDSSTGALHHTLGSGANQASPGTHGHTPAEVGAVAKAGDTMTGPLALSADPTLALQAATKQYVDARAGALHFHLQGLAAAGPKQVQVLLEKSLTAKKVWLYSDDAPVGSDLVIDINKNGTTIWTTQANRAKVVAGQNAGSQTTFDVTAFAAGDRLSIDIDQVGSTIPGGNDLMVTLEAG